MSTINDVGNLQKVIFIQPGQVVASDRAPVNKVAVPILNKEGIHAHLKPLIGRVSLWNNLAVTSKVLTVISCIAIVVLAGMSLAGTLYLLPAIALISIAAAVFNLAGAIADAEYQVKDNTCGLEMTKIEKGFKEHVQEISEKFAQATSGQEIKSQLKAKREFSQKMEKLEFDFSRLFTEFLHQVAGAAADKRREARIKATYKKLDQSIAETDRLLDRQEKKYQLKA